MTNLNKKCVIFVNINVSLYYVWDFKSVIIDERYTI